MEAADQARYARQILLAGVGVAGQARVLAASAAVGGSGLGHEVATRYALRAGFGAVVPGTLVPGTLVPGTLAPGSPVPGSPGAGSAAGGDEAVVRHAAPAAVLAGSRAALRAFRRAALSSEEGR